MFEIISQCYSCESGEQKHLTIFGENEKKGGGGCSVQTPSVFSVDVTMTVQWSWYIIS